MKSFIVSWLIGAWLFAFLANVGLATVSPVRPYVTFVRDFYLNDPFSQSYCIENGEFGSAYGTQPDAPRELYQICRGGQIGLFQQTAGVFQIRLGGIGRTSSSVAFLGTANDLQAKYNLTTDALIGIGWTGSSFNIMTTYDPPTYVPLSTNDTDELLTTVANNLVNINVSNIFIGRVNADDNVGAGSLIDGTLFMIKGMLIASDPQLQWGRLVWEVIGFDYSSPDDVQLGRGDGYGSERASKPDRDWVSLSFSISAVLVSLVSAAVVSYFYGYMVAAKDRTVESSTESHRLLRH